MNMNTMSNNNTMRRINNMTPRNGGKSTNRRQLMDPTHTARFTPGETELYTGTHPCPRDCLLTQT